MVLAYPAASGCMLYDIIGQVEHGAVGMEENIRMLKPVDHKNWGWDFVFVHNFGVRIYLKLGKWKHWTTVVYWI